MMRRRDLLAAIGLLVVALVPTSVSAQRTGNIVIESAWSPPTPGGAKTAAIYFTVRNAGPSADRIVGAATPAAEHADLHTTIRDGDVMRMRHVVSVEVPAGGKVMFAANGFHLMLTGLKAPLKIGDTVPFTVTFADAGEISGTAEVRR